MPAAPATAAFLHAHGLDIAPEGLDAALVEALSSRHAILYPFAARSGLTSAEADALRLGGFDMNARELGKEDPVVRAAAEHAAILTSAWTTGEAADRLACSDGRIRQRLAERTLYGVHGRRRWLIPSFQFGPTGEIPGWDRVAPLLPETLSAVVLLGWLTRPNPDLVLGVDEAPTSPRDWLLSGHDPAQVAELAAGLP